MTRLRALSLILLALYGSGCVDGASADRGDDVALAARTVAARAPLSSDSLVRVLGCGLCHAGLPVPSSPIAPPLESNGARDADRTWSQLQPGDGGHPDFHLDAREAVALARFLDAEPRRSTVPAAREAGRLHAHTSDDGERLFIAFNCVACHARTGVEPRRNGPVLAIEGARVRSEWLREFLRAPRAVRPFGVRPGDGGRMPHFALSVADIDTLSALLLSVATALPPFTPDVLSSFAMRKTGTLMRTRFSCLGCHALDADGGRIGPDLAAAGHRLQPAYIRTILSDPSHVAPGTIMPATVAPDDALDAIASALSSRTMSVPVPSERAGYLSPLDHPLAPDPIQASSSGARHYAALCSACHGAGAGDGFNASFLNTAPADHTDANVMSARTDARLYDAIAGGARFLDGSPEMPGFGTVLSASEIRDLVAFMRSLCACTQPAWAADGAGMVER